MARSPRPPRLSPRTIPSENAAAATEDLAEPTPPRTVNLEVVLDDSGSMGQLVDTGETRLARIIHE